MVPSQAGILSRSQNIVIAIMQKRCTCSNDWLIRLRDCWEVHPWARTPRIRSNINGCHVSKSIGQARVKFSHWILQETDY
ncbi:hypothetical protein SUGI_1132890 [Cryptomeria japonica]|nr:hypothetical protein SUGI_1132890 [Cryptomeria japonica]